MMLCAPHPLCFFVFFLGARARLCCELPTWGWRLTPEGVYLPEEDQPAAGIFAPMYSS